MTKTQIGLVIAFIAAATTTSVVQYRTNAALENQLSSVEKEIASVVASSPEVPAEPSPEGHSLRLPAEDSDAEITRLKNEVVALRQKVRELNGFATAAEEKEALRQRLGGQDFEIETQPAAPFSTNRYYQKELWADVGLDSPEATLQTALWAARIANVERHLETYLLANRTEEQKAVILERAKSKGFGWDPTSNSLGIRIEVIEPSRDPSEMVYHVVLDKGKDQAAIHARYSLRKVEGVWLIVQKTSTDHSPEDYFVPR
jgi:hypothetical protein